ncbi:MAG: hypothetical protein N4A40_15805, partial [Tissierellales bacterium]|nr:hypothetical protein [Tissierellales bacterium]
YRDIELEVIDASRCFIIEEREVISNEDFDQRYNSLYIHIALTIIYIHDKYSKRRSCFTDWSL